jgi:single-strand DNA-binding protein
MLNLNEVKVVGNLVENPRVLYSPNGSLYTTMRIAHNEFKGETTYIDVYTYEKLAKTAADFLTKGRRVYISGQIKQRFYLNKDHVKITTYYIQANDWHFLDTPKKEEVDEPEGMDTTPRDKDFEDIVNEVIPAKVEVLDISELEPPTPKDEL